MYKVALLGRPNVGKSTIFNRLIRSNRAITHDRPGVTRDRIEGFVRPRNGQRFTLIDTGGVTLGSNAAVLSGPKALEGFEEDLFAQFSAALEEADALCLIVDGREGLHPFDEHIAAHIRKLNKPTIVAVNKVDGLEKEDIMLADFHSLGFPTLAISAEHGHNVRALEEELSDLLPIEPHPESDDKDKVLRLAMLGRPNSGKSSLVNAMIGNNRMIVSDIAGTTQDSVDVAFEQDGESFMFIDTAGVRRRTRITDEVERFAVNASIKSTTKAQVTLYVIDALEGITTQDKRLIDLLNERKCPFCILVNKIDLVRKKDRLAFAKEFKSLLEFTPHVPVLYISAMHGIGLEEIIPLAKQIREECNTRISTGQLNRAIQEVLERHQPPVVRRVRPNFFYLTQAESNPPTFVFFVSDADRVSASYTRYLENSLRRLFAIKHAPMRVRLRSSHNKDKGKKKR